MLDSFRGKVVATASPEYQSAEYDNGTRVSLDFQSVNIAVGHNAPNVPQNTPVSIFPEISMTALSPQTISQYTTDPMALERGNIGNSLLNYDDCITSWGTNVRELPRSKKGTVNRIISIRQRMSVLVRKYAHRHVYVEATRICDT